MTTTTDLAAAPAAVAPVDFSADELEQFERKGYVIARQLVEPAVRRQMLEVTRAGLASGTGPVEYEAELRYPGAPLSRGVAGGDTIRRLKEAHGRDPIFTQWVGSPPLANRLAQLLGPRPVMPLAHHNCIMTKQPQYSSQTGWHQDIRYWSYRRPDLISVWLALGDETLENGCLQLIPGTHRLPIDRERLDDALFLKPDLPKNAALIAQKISAPLAAGDVLFFHCRTFHAAGRNETSQPKFSVVFTFRPHDNPPVPGTRSASMPELVLP